ncbi:MAG: Gfo/Idh/MocA family oxidoreductase [Clostridia bacterium]|nr:Gfo/Idh/MocA family oxidoreductase [Clostridia bacterium]MBQ8819116.1 Gfo/Idh/MocA family oxidoreductase [Clostridia bacterium]
MEQVRLGILGLGNMGSSHAKKIFEGQCPEIVLTAVADKKPDRMDWAKENLGDTAVFATAEEMIDSGLIDALLVAVPHYDHPKYSIMAMRKGLHVMCEKPAGVYTNQVLEMNKVADECGVVFALMMNQRTNCIYRKMREIIKSGEMGQIRRTSWIITDWYRPQAYYNSGDWRATWSGEGGGVLLNQCPHNLDLWQWICGMPKVVDAKVHFGKWHDIEVEDDVTAYVEYENGATGTFITTTGDMPGTNRFEVTLEKGKLIAERIDKEFSLTQWISEDGMTEPEFSAVNQKPFGTMKFIKTTVETDGENPQHMGVMRAFAAHILRGEPLVADGREGINGLTISNAMHLSAFTGKAIEIASFDHDLYEKELMKRVATSRRKETVAGATAADMDNTFGS